MSDSGVNDSGRQLYGDGDYKPSERASTAASHAKSAGAGSNPVVSEKGGGSDKTEEARKGTGENPKNNAGKSVPATDAAYKNSEDPNLSTRSVSERSA